MLIGQRSETRWPIYIINSFDKTKFLYTTYLPTQHQSFFRNYPFSYLMINETLNNVRLHVELLSTLHKSYLL